MELLFAESKIALLVHCNGFALANQFVLSDFRSMAPTLGGFADHAVYYPYSRMLNCGIPLSQHKKKKAKGCI